MTEIHPSQEIVEQAIDRIARTADGALLYVLLQRRLMQVGGDSSEGALRADQGERRFAQHLIGLMAKGVLESGGRTGITGSSIGPGGSEQPVVVARASPVRTGPERFPGGRRIGPNTRVAGYDRPDDT